MQAGIDYFWQYQIELCSAFTDYKIVTEEGLLVANTWTEAIERLIGYYGEEELSVIRYLEAFEFGSGIIPKQEINEIKWKEEE